jgi:ribosome-associated protein
VQINPEIEIPESLIHEKFVHGSGPGGQNVNKVATTVQLSINLHECLMIPEYVIHRLEKIASHRINKEGILSIHASNYRSQVQNREDARRRLKDLFISALKTEKERIETRRPHSADLKRLKEKQKTSQKKQLRKTVRIDDE